MDAIDPHTAYVIAAYAATVLVVAGLFLKLRLDHRRLVAQIAALEARGVRRRSEGGAR